MDPARKGRLDEAREKIAALGFPVVPLDQPMAARAAALRARISYACRMRSFSPVGKSWVRMRF